MAGSTKTLILSLSAFALLAGCDDSGSSTNTSNNWLTWFQPSQSSTASIYIPQREYSQSTQAGDYLAGQFAQYRQDWTTANEYIDRVLARDAGNIELQQRAMILSIQAGDANRAIAMARKVLEQDKGNVLALTIISMDQISRQDYSGVIDTLHKMPHNPISDFIKPILSAWVKAPEGAQDDDALVNASPLHAYHALLIADYHGKVADANRYFINILASSDVDTHIMERIGDIFARNDADELAKKIYEAILKHNRQNGASLAEIKSLQDKLDAPKQNAGKPLATPAEGAAEAFFNMANMLYQDNNTESALVFARIAEFLSPTKEENKILIAGIMMRSGQPDKAIEILRTVKSDSVIFFNAQRSAAEMMEQEGHVEEAIAYLEAIYADHHDVNALIQIGDTWRRADKHDLAIKAYDRAEAALGGKITADNWQLLYARGMSYERFGNIPRAEADLQKAIEFKPDHPYLLNYLGYSWADQGKHMEKAIELITKAASLRPDDGYITDSLGWVYYKLGDYGDAVTTLEKAIELLPTDPTINDHLGDAYWQVGRKQEARFQWQRALNNNKKDELPSAVIQSKIENGIEAPKQKVQQAKKTPVDAVSIEQ